MSPTISKWIRELASTFIILVVLAIFMCFYFLRYVPNKRSEFNRGAFLELNQMKDAFQYRHKAYRDAIENIISQGSRDTTAILNFNYRAGKNNIIRGNRIDPTRFVADDTNRVWRMEFPIYHNDAPTFTLSRNIDTLMSELVSTYKDVFDNYILIKCGKADAADHSDSIKNRLVILPGLLVNTSTNSPGDAGGKQNGEVIYQSGDMTLDYQINTDSLLKKNNGFNLLNVLDVTIEGNPYQLFLTPFKIADQRLIIAGLISEQHYTQAYQRIPFNFFAVFVVLFLLLVIHLPILKIYMLGVNERIRDWDIRLIIASYFIAAFFGFFLLTTIFLNKELAAENRHHLDALSDQIVNNLTTELDSMDRQLTMFDDTLRFIRNSNDISHLRAMISEKVDSSIRYLDSVFKPRIYPYMQNVFWIDTTGQWTARWAFMKAFKKSPLIDVKDRQYFKDFIKNEPLLVPGVRDPITIQPTLSKLEGEYVVTVVKKSEAPPISIFKDSFRINPYLIGMSSEMHSVSHVIMPPGYGFSIIDNQGTILYDSKPGRPLLSNFFKETEKPELLRQTAIYRTRMNFDQLQVRGKTMALLSRPLAGMPYQLIVYFNRSHSDEFEEHLVGLSALLMGAVLSFLICSAFVNQWSKRKPRLLQSRSQHFEWLHPSAHPAKQKYYVHLTEWMLRMLAVYIISWIVISRFFTSSEFSLLYISLLFPIYVSIHYYEIRERYYDSRANRYGIITYLAHPSPALRGLLLTMIIFINCLTLIGGLSKNIGWPVFLTQMGWFAVIFWSSLVMEKTLSGPISSGKPGALTNLGLKTGRAFAALFAKRFNKNPGNSEMSDLHAPAKKTFFVRQLNKLRDITDYEYSDRKIRPYVWAILTGVGLVSIIPAFGIFWLLFSHETRLDMKTDQLAIAKQIDQRRHDINRRMSEYNFSSPDKKDSQALNELKFSHGIYMVSGKTMNDSFKFTYSPLVFPSPHYVSFHQQFFPQDSTVFSSAKSVDSAWDGSWYFGDTLRKSPDDARELVFTNQRDNTNIYPFRLAGDDRFSWNSTTLLDHSLLGTVAVLYIVSIFFSMLLAYFLTGSLTRRVFLLDLKRDSESEPKQITEAEKEFSTFPDKDAIRAIFSTSGSSSGNTSTPSAPAVKPTLKDVYILEKGLTLNFFETRILYNLGKLEAFYALLWASITERQKFILYDFAQDGFSNYKSEKDLLELVTKGLLFFDDLRLTTVTLSFQEYILNKKDQSITDYISVAAKSDTWKKFKTPLLIVLAGVGVFIFFTQDAIYQKITGLLTSLTSILPVLRDLLDKKD